MAMPHRCGMDRRQFLRLAGGTAASLALPPLAGSALAAGPVSRTPIYPKRKARVTLVFSHLPSDAATWPHKGYDYDARRTELTRKLTAACPGIEFTIKTARSKEEGKAILDQSADADGFLVWALGIWTWAVDPFMRSGRPTVMVDDLFAGSGETLIASGAARREKLPAVFVSSSNFEDVVAAAKLFEALAAMKSTRILDVTDGDLSAVTGRIKEVYGAQVLQLTSKELSAVYEAADPREAAEWADHWIKGARKVVEPQREELIKSGRMYLALSRAMSEHRCDAVTMNCLGLFYSGATTAYPCLAFFQMNNDGSTGVCESDLNSTCTQLIMRYLTGRPGYVSDPVIDTARQEIIYAHCVAHNRPFGPKGKENPYIIRSHAEDGKGASVQSLLPVGEMVTTLEMDVWGKRMVIHTGKTTRNVDDPKACRTKLAARTEAERVLDNWDMGWHRVTVYGDWRKQAINLARLMGFSVFEEDRA